MELLTIDNFDEYILRAPLYKEYKIQCDSNFIDNLFVNHHAFNAYCPKCKEVCTFTISSNQSHVTNFINGKRSIAQGYSLDIYAQYKIFMLRIDLICSKNPSHHISVYNNIDDNIMKIGQYPEVPTFLFPEKGKYDKYLNQYSIEYKTALQVYSHGTGIGSFVYLRRVFEFLAEEYHQKALKEPSWDEEAYKREKFGEKIKMIEKYHQFIPDELRDYTTRIYGILSQGIHELDEGECLTLFPTLKFIIEHILDEKVEKAKQAAKLREALKELGQK